MTPGAAIPIGSIPNLRDLGGYTTVHGGTVRSSLLYRSVALSDLTDADLPLFEALGVRTVFDLRTEAERTARPDRVLDGVRHVVLDVLADSVDAAPARLEALLSDPATARDVLGDGRSEALFEQGYRELVTLDSARTAYHDYFVALLEEPTTPALFHCTTGKDRTGWAAACTLMLLGVPREHVVSDYLCTNRDLLPAMAPVLAQFARAGGDPALLEPVLGVEAEYLETSLQQVETQFGSLAGYFSEGLRLDAATQRELRSRFVHGT